MIFKNDEFKKLTVKTSYTLQLAQKVQKLFNPFVITWEIQFY